MKASRKVLIPLICIALAAVVSTAGAVQLAATGTNTVTGTAVAEGDIFATETTTGVASDVLYSGVWAHAYVPSGTSGTNSAESLRTVPARKETRTWTPSVGKSYTLTNNYGETTVVAKASKTGVLGSAEAFSEVSSLSSATDTVTTATTGTVGGYSQLAAYVSHSGTGTAEASASGSADYAALLKTGEIQASGSVSGSVALNAENNYGGTVTGAAWKASSSGASSAVADTETTYSESFEYLSLTSGRNALSAKSDILGTVAGDTSGSGFYALAGSPGKYGNTESSTTGDLSSTATTYKLGDSITPGSINKIPIAGVALGTKLDTAASKGIVGNLWTNFLGAAAPTASAYLISKGTVATSIAGLVKTHTSEATTDAFTSAGVTRTLADTNVVYGASYIDNGAVSASADTASAPGASPITIASSSMDTIFMGSGAHLISRLTGATPQSTADLSIVSTSSATSGVGTSTSTGSVLINGDADKATPRANTLVRAVGPSYSSTGTSDDATGSYLTALNIDGTATHAKDATAGFNSRSTLVASDIDEVNIWSWIDGSDPRTHAESAYGLTPFVSAPTYTISPSTLTNGITSGPTAIGAADATSRSVDSIFSSDVHFPGDAA